LGLHHQKRRCVAGADRAEAGIVVAGLAGLAGGGRQRGDASRDGRPGQGPCAAGRRPRRLCVAAL